MAPGFVRLTFVLFCVDLIMITSALECYVCGKASSKPEVNCRMPEKKTCGPLEEESASAIARAEATLKEIQDVVAESGKEDDPVAKEVLAAAIEDKEETVRDSNDPEAKIQCGVIKRETKVVYKDCIVGPESKFPPSPTPTCRQEDDDVEECACNEDLCNMGEVELYYELDVLQKIKDHIKKGTK